MSHPAALPLPAIAAISPRPATAARPALNRTLWVLQGVLAVVGYGRLAEV